MRYLTAGESHGPELTTIIEGMPAGVPLLAEDIDKELTRRQRGYGRGARMLIEKDHVNITSGVRHGKTLGSPIALSVENNDWKRWKTVMSIKPVEEEKEKSRRIARPRPGHADLVGGMKYGHRDLRNVLERSSARETTVRVAVGAIAKKLLRDLGIEIAGHVLEIGGVQADLTRDYSLEEIQMRSEKSPVRCLNEKAAKEMIQEIDKAKNKGDSIGGVVEVVAFGVPAGLGSYVQWDKKLDAKIARAIVSINAFKGVEFGIGFQAAKKFGSEVMDEIIWSKQEGYIRRTNHLGGFEGGMTNGMPLIVRGVMKPIPTLYKPLKSVDIDSKEVFHASVERSDSCAVPAASVVAEAVVAWEIAVEILEKFDGDRLDKLQKQVAEYREMIKEF